MAHARTAPRISPDEAHRRQEVRIPLAGSGAAPESALLADLTLPAGRHAITLVVDGRGLSRHAAQDRALAHFLQAQGLGTLLADFLTPEEQASQRAADLPRLTGRLVDAVQWVEAHPACAGLPVALCGLEAGSAPALLAAAKLGSRLSALACIGGWQGLPQPSVLSTVRASTLLLVGGREPPPVADQEAVYAALRCERSVALVPGAGRQLQEPGALAHAAEMVAGWLLAHALPELEETAP